MSRYNFEHAIVDTGYNRSTWIDTDRPGNDCWGGVTVADYDGDGRPEFTVGSRRTRGRGFLRVCGYLPDVLNGTWSRRIVTDAFRPGVGAAAADWDGDGRPELVAGAWNTEGLFHVIVAPADPDFGESCLVTEDVENPHDVLAADIDGDGREEVVAREKDGALVVYDVPEDPTDEWTGKTVDPQLDGDGTLVADLSTGDRPDIVTNCG